MEENVKTLLKNLDEISKKDDLCCLFIVTDKESKSSSFFFRENEKRSLFNSIINLLIKDPKFYILMQLALKFVDDKINENPNLIPDENKYANMLIDSWKNLFGSKEDKNE